MPILTSTLRVRLGRRPNALLLRPGQRYPVELATLDALLDAGNEMGRKLELVGVLQVEQDGRTPTIEPETLTALSIPRATPLIEAQSDREVLERWRAADDRAGIHALIERRLEALGEED